MYQWCGFKSRRGKKQNLTALISNSNTVWFNFQTFIIFSINLVSLVTLRSSGTDILYGCHLLLDVCIIYFISCDCIMNLHYPIQYIKNCWVRLLSNYNIKYTCTIYTRLYTCLTSITRVDVVEWSRALDVRLSEWCCSVSMVWVQIPSREETKFDSSNI